MTVVINAKIKNSYRSNLLVWTYFFFWQNEGFLQNQEPSFLTERAINMNEEETHIKV